MAICFTLGRLTTRREPFYFIGTPLNLKPGSAQASEDSAQPATQPLPDEQVASPRRDETTQTESALCGAPTKSGGACRRRVRGGGYCFQHRDKPRPAINTGHQ
jgi:hypothetical protein